MHDAIFAYEDRSQENIKQWIEFNQKALKEIEGYDKRQPAYQMINTRLLKMQVHKELDEWIRKAPHQSSLNHYASLIARALNPLLEADFLDAGEKQVLITERLNAVEKLCEAAKQNLAIADKTEAERGLQQLKKAKDWYENDWAAEFNLKDGRGRMLDAIENSTKSIQELILYVEANLPAESTTNNQLLGKEEYARQLELYTGSKLSPDQLGKMALEEIQLTKELIHQVSVQYLKEKYPDQTLPSNPAEKIKMAFADMEKDAPENGTEYLQFWQELADAAYAFIEENDIATLPAFPTLRITPAPESAGAAARIGWVDSSPPFAPNPVTTLYLPSIPDDFPKEERKDFWSSFNKPFNRMIVIHELLPGHYMQLKIARESPHKIRKLFPYQPYIEGWATFTEKVLLDAGWEEENKLTMLAHLRKRLENANRAYMSVQVHCNNWTQEQVMKFSTETSLLAPQFAKSLWGRLQRSPMQITSYFYGGKLFAELWEKEKSRLGDEFNLKYFMDTIMKAGAIPIDEFEGIFAEL